MRKISFETIWGGIFGVITIVATIVQAAMDGGDAYAIVGAVKDISATLIVVMVLIVALKSLFPKKAKSLPERLEQRLSEWQISNSTMIVKSQDDDKTGRYGFSMRTNVDDFYNTTPITKNVGWFVRLPLLDSEEYHNPGVVINFHLNKGTFFEGMPLSADELKQEFNDLNHRICNFIAGKYSDLITASGQNDSIMITFKHKLETDEEIAGLIDVLDSMFEAYLVGANRRA